MSQNTRLRSKVGTWPLTVSEMKPLMVSEKKPQNVDASCSLGVEYCVKLIMITVTLANFFSIFFEVRLFSFDLLL